MPVTLSGDGIQYGSGSTMRRRPFEYRDFTNAGYTYTTSWTNGWQTGNYAIPSRSKCLLRYNIPVRNDAYSNWGGGYYSRLYYQINDSGNWVDLGHSGYSTAMHTDSGDITRYMNHHHFDFTTITSDFNLKFLFQHLSYTSSGSVNGNDIGGAGQSGYHGNNTPFQWHLILSGYQVF